MTITQTGKNKNGEPDIYTAVQHVSFQQPDKLMYTLTSHSKAHGLENEYDVCDGKTQTNYYPNEKQYEQQPASPVHEFIDFVAAIPSGPPLPVVLNGRKCLLFTETQPDNKGNPSMHRFWIDAATHLPVRQATETQNADKGILDRFDYTDWKINAPLPASTFVFVPPPGAKLVGSAP